MPLPPGGRGRPRVVRAQQRAARGRRLPARRHADVVPGGLDLPPRGRLLHHPPEQRQLPGQGPRPRGAGGRRPARARRPGRGRDDDRRARSVRSAQPGCGPGRPPEASPKRCWDGTARRTRRCCSAPPVASLAGLLLGTFPNSAATASATAGGSDARGSATLRRAIGFIDSNAQRDIGRPTSQPRPAPRCGPSSTRSAVTSRDLRRQPRRHAARLLRPRPPRARRSGPPRRARGCRGRRSGRRRGSLRRSRSRRRP
jgi:hypothetical protein